MKLINGMFFINNDDDAFYLREANAWSKKGKLVRSHVVGLASPEPSPFTALQAFELALSETDERYHSPFSDTRSAVTCLFPTSIACSLALTDSLSAFLGYGTNVICTASFAPNANKATLVFNDTIVRARSPLWVVMPAAADPAMAGIRCLFASEPL